MINELNSVTVMGNIAGDLYFESKDDKITFGIFRLATHRSHRHPEKDVVTETTFISCLVHKGLAEIASRILSKGDKVIVTGRLVNHDKNIGGQTFTETQVSCNNFIKISLRENKDGTS